jgi:hypothetical protein
LSGGQPLPTATRAQFEGGLGRDLGGVRVHHDDKAAATAEQMSARAFTYGHNIVFGAGQYQPDSTAGKHLLAHELTHVVQQGGAGPASAGAPSVASVQRKVQRSFWGSIWGGIKKIGQGIAAAASWVGGAIAAAGSWVVDRLRDAGMWLVNLVRDLPARLIRLIVTLWDGVKGVVSFVPEMITQIAQHGFSGFGDWLWDKIKDGGAWVGTLLLRVLDLVGVPEIGEFLMHLFSHIRRLSGAEINAAKSVLGPSAIRYGEVRVASGGWLSLVFKNNNGRAFTTFHTLNMPPGEQLDVFVHELTHVYQYERVGSIYIPQAIHAQNTAVGYNYGDGAGLVQAKAQGRHYRSFNREQQAQIAQDYYRVVIAGGGGGLSAAERAAYDFFIGELRAGKL